MEGVIFFLKENSKYFKVENIWALKIALIFHFKNSIWLFVQKRKFDFRKKKKTNLILCLFITLWAWSPFFCLDWTPYIST